MASLFKSLKKSMLGRLVKRILGKKDTPPSFAGSSAYWEKRYAIKSNSGSGSYGRLADFKAEVLNKFVADNKINTIIEYGVGDGNQLSLANYPNYIGFDVSQTAIDLCNSRFKDDATKQFSVLNADVPRTENAELTLSLDVIYHLVEDEVFNQYMSLLFASASRYVIIYSSNYDDHFAPHVKSRKFTTWIDAKVSKNWRLKEHVKNKYPFNETDPDNTSMADFYFYEKISHI